MKKKKKGKSKSPDCGQSDRTGGAEGRDDSSGGSPGHWPQRSHSREIPLDPDLQRLVDMATD